MSEGIKPYSLEQALEEANVLRQKIESGETVNYNEAKRQAEIEKSAVDLVYLKNGLDSWFRLVDSFWTRENHKENESRQDSEIEEKILKAIKSGIDSVLHQEPKDFRAHAKRIDEINSRIVEYNNKHTIQLPWFDKAKFDPVYKTLNKRSTTEEGGDVRILLTPFLGVIRKIEADANTKPTLNELVEQGKKAGISAVMGNAMVAMQEFMDEAMTFLETYEQVVKENKIADAPNVQGIMPTKMYSRIYMAREAVVNRRLNPPLFITRRLGTLLDDKNLNLIQQNSAWSGMSVLSNLSEVGAIEKMSVIKKVEYIKKYNPSFNMAGKVEIPDLARIYPLLDSALNVAYKDSFAETVINPDHILNTISVRGGQSFLEVEFKFNSSRRSSFDEIIRPYTDLIPDWKCDVVDENDHCKIVLKRK